MKVKKINWLLMVIHLVVGFGISAVLVLVGGSSLPYEMADLMAGMAVFGLILSALSLLILGALFYAVGKNRWQAVWRRRASGAPAGLTATMPSWRLTRTRGK